MSSSRAEQQRLRREQIGRPELLMGLSPAHVEEMSSIFELFDQDNSGSIDPKEIREQMRSLGFDADNTTIYQLISDLDNDGSQKLEFGELAELLTDKIALYSPEYTSREHMREVFDYMDDLDPLSRDKKIDATNLKRIAKVLGDSITDAEIQVMIDEADRDKKGYVSAEDFYVVMAEAAHRMEQPPASDEKRLKQQEVVSSRWKQCQKLSLSSVLASAGAGPAAGSWKQLSMSQVKQAVSKESPFRRTVSPRAAFNEQLEETKTFSDD
eukprot:TRINITY_DN54557_c0_g1_i1.p1 TRINITY_DN54557_c0_g1~~TRINITY_DN54557_c0_g1_i1.p1  ORF type:complete len:268 (+),score=60.70 TRINITY_DN54557_c0_g1_i1:52-855(+)